MKKVGIEFFGNRNSDTLTNYIPEIETYSLSGHARVGRVGKGLEGEGKMILK